jgi:hypothetical protein
MYGLNGESTGGRRNGIGTVEIAFRANQNKKKFRSCLYLFCHVASDVAGPSRKAATWRSLIVSSGISPA